MVPQLHPQVPRALRQKKGVCQDFAHILISIARQNRLPARYINGFLLEETTSGENTTHTWAEIFIKHLGWVDLILHIKDVLMKNILE